MSATDARTLSEFASKELVRGFGIPTAREALVGDASEAVAAARGTGGPVALKLCGDAIAHKTERDLVRLGVFGDAAVARAADELLAKARPEDGEVGLLVAEMVGGKRELIAGLIRDPNFGPCVMLGLGGILAEALGDVAFARVPVSPHRARGLLDDLQAARVVSEPFRGEPAIDREALAAVVLGLSRLAEARPDVASVDLNPLIVSDGRPVAVDALVELASVEVAASPKGERGARTDREILERLDPLFKPKGIVVAGVSSHPGKFGSVAYHNLRRFGYRGELFPINRDGAEVLGAQTLRDIREVPEGAADLVFVCTPFQANIDLLRAAAARGVRAAFIASGGYAETGQEGRALQDELVRTARELGMVVAGPNGQGVISTPLSMCAQIVAPYPPPGRISVASQSGNLVSSYLNYAT
ncbi:MAG: hypothetical protein HKP27_03140, partial [Myxococcales bacterium]|nr:hypothetical protein [Myxococcales bacterium]